MAKQKYTRKKKAPKKSRKKRFFKSSIIKAFAGLTILIVLVVLGGLLTHFLISPPKSLRPSAPPKSIPPIKQPVAKTPPFEVYPKKEIPLEIKPVKPVESEKKRLPMVAIIIDDLGYDFKLAKKLSQLGTVLTFSILPHSPYQEKIAKLSQSQGFETILHLPMEPMEYPSVNPGPGTLLTSMTPDQLLQQLEKDLDAVPFIKGVNNHMGSKMTAESSQMYQIFSVLKKRNLYFVDSRTTRDTLCKPSARLFQIPFAQRDIFLDHRQDAKFIRQQIKKLVQIAKQNGQAIGIGHPHSITYNILREMLPDLQKEVQLVPTSKIVRLLG
jgi:polysaccharide deacetylase 2 family uncharacterized protein YibQ